MGIGARLKEIIDNSDTNVNKLAKLTNTSPMTIYSIIKRDNTKVDIDILLRICKALNISVEDIYQPNFKNDGNGKAEKDLTTLDLNDDEIELIKLFRKLSHKDQQRYIGHMENTVESAIPETSTIYRAARSTDNHPPEIIETTTDFSKIPPTKNKL